eukprot:1307877-Amphidinium_carterae.1
MSNQASFSSGGAFCADKKITTRQTSWQEESKRRSTTSPPTQQLGGTRVDDAQLEHTEGHRTTCGWRTSARWWEQSKLGSVFELTREVNKHRNANLPQFIGSATHHNPNHSNNNKRSQNVRKSKAKQLKPNAMSWAYERQLSV